MVKEMLGAKVASKTLDRLEDYADREGISKSEATDRLLKQGLDVEESDMRLVPVRSDGGTIIEDKLDQNEERLTQIDNEIEKVGELRRYAYIIGLALVWIGAESVFELPSYFVIASGIVLLVLLVYPLANAWTEKVGL